MPGGRLAQALRHIRGLLETRAAGEHTDRTLLERFATVRDETAFAALVQRHGPMVLAVCRRVLGDAHAAEDTFQATFLVLAQKATALDRRGSVAGWLFTVAYHIALRAQSAIARRESREQQIMDIPCPTAETPLLDPDVKTCLDAELSRLPEKYRVPLVLCYLEGKTNDEAAEQLGWPSGTVKGRLARARELLRQRLAQRGVGLSLALLGTALAEQGAAAVPERLAHSTVQLATLVGAGCEIAGRISAAVAALAEGAIQDLARSRLKLVLAVAVAALCVGAGALAHQAWTIDPPKTGTEASSRPAVAAATDERLPAGATAQFGHASLVMSVAFSPNGRLLAVEQADWRIDIWELATKKRLTSLRVHDFAPAIKGDIRLDIQLGKCGLWSAPPPLSFAFAPDSKSVFARGGDLAAEKPQIFQWDAATGNELQKFDADGAFCLSTDGSKLAAVRGKVVRVWQTGIGQEQQAIEVPEIKITSLTFTADAKGLLLSDASSQTVHIWDLGANKMAGKLQVNWPSPLPEPRPFPVFSPDSRHMAAGGSWDGSLHLLEVTFGEAQKGRLFKVQPGLLHSATFSADSKKLAVVCQDQTVAVLDVGSSEVLHWVAASVPQAGINAVALSPDGKHLVTGCTDGRALLWPIR